ncbi:MAG: hypothetical protein WBB34_11560 [Xanthobacteraceae bacterium]
MSFNPLLVRALGMAMAGLGAAGGAWIYWDDFRGLRLRLVHGDASASPLCAEQWIVLIAMLAALVIPAYVWVDQSWPTLPPDRARHLLDDQKVRMAAILNLQPSEHYSVEINSVQNCDECEDYAQEFRDFIGSIPGWKATGSVITFWDPSAPRTGLQLIVGTKASSEVEKKLLGAFAAASITLSPSPPQPLQGLDAIIIVARIPK